MREKKGRKEEGRVRETDEEGRERQLVNTGDSRRKKEYGKITY